MVSCVSCRWKNKIQTATNHLELLEAQAQAAFHLYDTHGLAVEHYEEFIKGKVIED